MERKNICYFLVLSILFSFSCFAQVNETSLIKVKNNKELKYVLTYLEASEISFYADGKHHFFVKTFKIRSDSYILVDKEERIQKEYFYFLVSSFDEEAHHEVRLFKTKSLINPVLSNISESKEGKKFLIHISVFIPKINIGQSSISVKSENFYNNKKLVFKINKY